MSFQLKIHQFQKLTHIDSLWYIHFGVETCNVRPLIERGILNSLKNSCRYNFLAGDSKQFPTFPNR